MTLSQNDYSNQTRAQSNIHDMNYDVLTGGVASVVLNELKIHKVSTSISN